MTVPVGPIMAERLESEVKPQIMTAMEPPRSQQAPFRRDPRTISLEHLRTTPVLLGSVRAFANARRGRTGGRPWAGAITDD